MNKIDLHGVKHEEVKKILDSFIWKNMSVGSSSVEIITGKSVKMKEIVSSVLSEYGYSAKESLTNDGVMVVYML